MSVIVTDEYMGFVIKGRVKTGAVEMQQYADLGRRV